MKNMSADLTSDPSAETELRRFERNRYFDGKLLTARDMQAEQGYHRNRLHVFARSMTGTGVLTGLEATVEGDGDGVEVVVEPGVAVDPAGRLIVVPETETRRLSGEVPAEDVVYLYMTYAETLDERVPKPGSEAVADAENDCAYNRVLETFEVRLDASAPGRKAERIPAVEFPTGDDVDADEAAALAGIARSYRENASAPPDEVAVFLGAFEPGSWNRVAEETDQRSVVYDNDLLYAALVRHVTDFDNPHEVTAEGAAPASGDGISEVRVREIVDDELEAVRSRANALERYVMHRSLLEKRETFVGVAQRFRDHHVGDIAREILEGAARAIEDGTFEDAESYRALVADLAEYETEIADIVEDEERSTEEARDQYRDAVDDLRDASDEDASVLEVVVAQDAVCTAAKRLERPVNV